MRISVQGENPRPAQTMSPCLVLSTEFQPSPLPNCLKTFELFFEISNPNPPWKTSQFPQPVASVTFSRLKHRGAGTSDEGAQVHIKKKIPNICQPSPEKLSNSALHAKQQLLGCQGILSMEAAHFRVKGDIHEKKKKKKYLGQLNQHDLVFFLLFFSVNHELRRIKMPLCQPDALRIWPHGQIKDCSYTRSSLILR